MKILTGCQIGQADALTVRDEGIEPIDLMERAAEQIALWICQNVDQSNSLLFFTGKGNNGGDGLAAARILHNAGFSCRVYTPFGIEQMSRQCAENFRRLPDRLLTDEPAVSEDTIIVDALLGSGMSGEVREPLKSLIESINASDRTVISIDIPSGMNAEDNAGSRTIVNAATTLTIQYPKLAMMLPEAGEHAGNIEVIDIGIDTSGFASPYNYIEPELISAVKRRRSKFAYKKTCTDMRCSCAVRLI
ncbi:MAG: NAD(P)H-hydrate epimerase [Alistipes putredinis]|nr:MAG: NAD(P)H-hydrate epimerase [Alistipes putredinis]